MLSFLFIYKFFLFKVTQIISHVNNTVAKSYIILPMGQELF